MDGFKTVKRKSVLDADGDGFVSQEEMAAAVANEATMQQQTGMLKWAILGLIITLIVSMAGLFGSVVLSSELAKEFKVVHENASNATLVSSDGQPIETIINLRSDPLQVVLTKTFEELQSLELLGLSVGGQQRYFRIASFERHIGPPLEILFSSGGCPPQRLNVSSSGAVYWDDGDGVFQQLNMPVS